MRPIGFTEMSNVSVTHCESPGTLSIHTFRGFPRIIPMETPAASAGRLFALQWPTFLRLTNNPEGRRKHDPQEVQRPGRGGAPGRRGVAVLGARAASREKHGEPLL